MNATLTDAKSSSDNQRENSNPNNGDNYMAFTYMVNSKSLEEIEKSDSSNEDSEGDRSCHLRGI